jgi:hypothetical protein
MTQTRSSTLLIAVLTGALLCACAHRDVRQESAPQSRQALENPSDFPLYPRSVVVTVVPVSSAQIFAAMKASDPSVNLPRNFRGHEIIAETDASMAQLDVWISKLNTAPPHGFHNASDRHGTATFSTKERDVVVGANLENASGDRSVFIIAADPRKLRDALGPAFALIDNYQAVPGMVRGPLDESAKKELGYSVSEMLDAKSPVGAAIATLKRMQSGNRRAILLIDESQAK